MALTPEQIAKIRQKEAKTPDALKRNPLNDYTEGWFHVTLNTRGEAPVLGYLAGDPDAEDGSRNAPRCVLTELGKKVEECWRGIGRYHPSCVCEEIQVMPEHLHALLHLLPGNKVHLGRIINGLMIGCTHAYWDTLGIPWREMREHIDGALKRFVANNNADATATKAEEKAIRAQWQDRDHTRSFRGPALMVRGYNDVEAVTEEEIEIKRRYIRNNPRKRLIVRSKPDRFRVMRNQRSRNWTMVRALAAVTADPWIGRYPEKCRALQNNVRQRLYKREEQEATLLLDYVGNRALLSAERKVSLICHRADAALFEQQKAAVMQAAREGAVVVGAFYSIAENRHVQMTCWTYKYKYDNDNDNGDGNGNDNDNGNRSQGGLSREMCLVMNELVRIISGVKDDWWKSA